MAENLAEFCARIPPNTKWLTGATLALTLAGNWGLIPIGYLGLVFDLTFKHLEIWRLVSTFFFAGQLSFPFVVNMFFLYSKSRHLEEDAYRNKPAEYLFFLCFSGFILVLIGFALNLWFLFPALMFSVIYRWSREYETLESNYMGWFKFEGRYLPWVLCLFQLLTGSMPILPLFGIIAGHIYHFLTVTYPAALGRNTPLISAPWFFYRLFPGYPAPAAQAAQMNQVDGNIWRGVPRQLGAGRAHQD